MALLDIAYGHSTQEYPIGSIRVVFTRNAIWSRTTAQQAHSKFNVSLIK